MSKKSPQLAASPSYYNLLSPFMVDCNLYGTCPPVTKHPHLTARSSTNTMLHIARRSGPHKTSIRAFNFNVNPLNPLIWRHSTHKSLHAIHSHSKKQSHVAHQSVHPHPHHAHAIHHYLYPPPHPHTHHHHHHRHLHSHTYNTSPTTTASSSEIMVDPQTPKEFEPPLIKDSSHAIIMQRSLPIFEVLPPLVTNDNNLLYQNSIMLDGFNYEYEPGQTPDDASHCKLHLDYYKFLKCITAKNHPSDGEVIFGNAQLVRTKSPPGWERSRIQWLTDLELRYEEHLSEQRWLQSKRLDDDDDDHKLDLCWMPWPRSLLHWDLA